uniref:Uncharacterized protein n=1 Tax=Chromera velia CCMP2878 TaxID=1169474 RepID=A0A0G4HW39_9ALVE|eukprot:Cvel_8969.t1-p1 / transcript=Cvel_8969.t1 / gene=Cvel_8969 / organism=Chromera_velia_CCMP2878 / gene_product=hypothetical protein / transcript_product=hypothetical protein / location=Cvel_scaffold506:7643-10772(+) / protein_length=302 / sequence_SO=supercontig / SO=protein_coding / is_pseudo=false
MFSFSGFLQRLFTGRHRRRKLVRLLGWVWAQSADALHWLDYRCALVLFYARSRFFSIIPDILRQGACLFMIQRPAHEVSPPIPLGYGREYLVSAGGRETADRDRAWSEAAGGSEKNKGSPQRDRDKAVRRGNENAAGRGATRGIGPGLGIGTTVPHSQQQHQGGRGRGMEEEDEAEAEPLSEPEDEDLEVDPSLSVPPHPDSSGQRGTVTSGMLSALAALARVPHQQGDVRPAPPAPPAPAAAARHHPRAVPSHSQHQAGGGPDGLGSSQFVDLEKMKRMEEQLAALAAELSALKQFSPPPP